MFLFIDVSILLILLKISPYLDTAMQAIVAVIGIVYFSARALLQVAKLIVFCSKNWKWIKGVFKFMKDNFNER